MKYSGSIEINKAQALVADLFADPKHLNKYQDGFEKKELIKGVAGEVGAVSKLYYSFGNRQMELKETITQNKLPDSFEATYEHEHMDNTMKCKFIPIGKNKTRYEYEFRYTRINWFLPRLTALLFPGMYKKQGEKWMRQFKEFVERQ